MTINCSPDTRHNRTTSDIKASKERAAAITLSSILPTQKGIKCKGITKRPSSPKKSKISIPVHDIVRYLTLPQPLVADRLGVSISTLKRRYYELHFGRWPVNSSNGDNGCDFLSSKQLSSADKTRMANLLNDRPALDERTIDQLTLKVLQCAFTQNTINVN
ncbi:hypothetical protein AKO1_001700 [Acrasis kona]|uniref:RWP-RK domain-containing protein n=1 Tax=Acrasis kona TaxID=1008807 RepID=A0AAW2Z9E4_9EUKA